MPGVYAFTWTGAPVGTHKIAARANAMRIERMYSTAQALWVGVGVAAIGSRYF